MLSRVVRGLEGLANDTLRHDTIITALSEAASTTTEVTPRLVDYFPVLLFSYEFNDERKCLM